MVYTLAEEELPFADELERTVTEKILESFHDEHDVWTIYLIAGKMTDSLRLRNMVSRALYKLITDGNKETVAAMYLVIIANSYLFIEKENLAMPLVAVDNKGQIQNIELLLYKIFSDFALRHSLLEVLEVYLKKINQYEVTERLLNQLKSYFYVIARKSERFNRDVQRFLSNLDKKGNTTAEKILLFLQEKLQKKELIKR